MRHVLWNRRQFLRMSGGALAAWPSPRSGGPVTDVTLFLGGDVMTGRGIDQVLPRPSRPRLHEAYVGSALDYVELAERAHGRISRPVTFSYVWGDLLSDLERRSPDLRIVNLETSVTTSEEALPKGINYRMHPANVPCLAAAKIDCCVLANNHILDWGAPGLRETLEALTGAGIATTGAGRSVEDAGRPAVLPTSGERRVLVFGLGMPSSGIPHDWAARDTRPGVNLLPDSSPRSVSSAVEGMERWRRSGDRVVASIHWGGNWGYDVPREHRELAHRLIERGVDVVHGHSSHHPKGIEVHEGRLVLYGCGDLLNDYEGISGHEEFRGDLVLGYLAALEPAGRLKHLDLIPYRIRGFRLERAAKEDTKWLRDTLDREGRALGTAVELAADGSLTVRWP
jgi:poly-gamma-glutamate capsule biosynthesis protein CapA/YwtB (metallophosphatase superfamily)